MFLNRKHLNLICRAVALLLRVLQMLLHQTHTPKYLKCILQEKDSLCFQNNSPNVQSQMSKYTRQDMESIFSALRTQTVSASWFFFVLPLPVDLNSCCQLCACLLTISPNQKPFTLTLQYILHIEFTSTVSATVALL